MPYRIRGGRGGGGGRERGGLLQFAGRGSTLGTVERGVGADMLTEAVFPEPLPTVKVDAYFLLGWG